MPAEIRSIGALRADRENDNTLLTPAECLEDAATDLRSGKRKCNKLMIIRLNTGDDGHSYNVGFNVCNMKSSEILALLEIAKIEIIKTMGYLPDEP